jgi:choline dehydrogenase-like flavoprotein
MVPIRSAPPRIDPKYLSDERDAALMLKGAKITRKIMDAPSLRKYRLKEVYTREGMDDAELMQHIRARADTIYHPVGTCKMGRDEMAVTDPGAQGPWDGGTARRRCLGDADR